MTGLDVVDGELGGPTEGGAGGQGVDDVRVAGFGQGPARLAAADEVRHVQRDAAPACRARDAVDDQVLGVAVDPVGELVVGVDAVELRAALIGEGRTRSCLRSA